ncbi:MAG TPA: hypothetical protein VE549_11165 [Myxococcaceae bacterium]|jgi:hypothetical protein|nr:hypothetical protein [Myxococcaceae bacterium]
MNFPTMLALAALACAILLVVQLKLRLWPAVAAVVSGLEVLLAFGIIHLSVAGFPLGTILGIALAVAGVFVWLKVQGKTHVSAATVIALVGAFQVLTAVMR